MSDTPDGAGGPEISENAPSVVESDSLGTSSVSDTSLEIDSAMVQVEGDGPSRRRRRAFFLVSIAAGLAVVVGVLIGVLGSGSRSDADAAVTNGATFSLASKTADLSMTLTLTEGPISITVGSDGAANFADNSEHIDLRAGFFGKQINLNEIYAGGVTYLQFPSSIPLPAGKSWWSFGKIAYSNSEPSIQNLGLAGGSPRAIMNLLGREGNVVTALGSSTLHGVAVQGYAVLISPTAVQADRAGVARSFGVAGPSLRGGSTKIDVFIDGAGDVIREVYNSSGSAGATKAGASITIDLSHYGTPISISAPPAGEVEPASGLSTLATASL
jgi:hypothetical protein